MQLDYGQSQDSSGGRKIPSGATRSTTDGQMQQSIFWSGPHVEQEIPSDPPAVLNVDDFFIMKASSECMYRLYSGLCFGAFSVHVNSKEAARLLLEVKLIKIVIKNVFIFKFTDHCLLTSFELILLCKHNTFLHNHDLCC